MSKKSFNDIEAFIKQLADAQQPAFEEEAWVKMEKLLAKEDRRKKPFFWWFVPMLISGVIISLIISQLDGLPFKGSKAQGHSLQPRQPNAKIASAPLKNVHGERTTNTPPLGLHSIEDVPKQSLAAKAPKANAIQVVNSAKTHSIELPLFAENRMPAAAEGASPKLVAQQFDRMLPEPAVQLPGKISAVAPIDAPGPTSGENDQLQATPEAATVKIKNYKARNSLYFLVGAGMEMNGLNLLPLKNGAAQIGVGLGYKLNRRFSLQTGVYYSAKKYVAAAKDYKAKPGSYWSTVNISKVDADCEVYEIPLTVRYDFKNKRRTGYFATAGLSSFVLKKEDYRYEYERYGSPHSSTASYKGNKHLFSVLRIAAGAERKLNPRWSLQVAPGLTVPLAGVGEGKVKLFSTDVTFSARYSLKKR